MDTCAIELDIIVIIIIITIIIIYHPKEATDISELGCRLDVGIVLDLECLSEITPYL